MKALHLICIGRYKDSSLENLEEQYLKRLLHPPLKIHEVKASAEQRDMEMRGLEQKILELKKNHPLKLIALTEHGENCSTEKFSNLLSQWIESQSLPTFVIAGAEGYPPDFLSTRVKELSTSSPAFLLSLSALTLPHKLARLLLVEQLYRAQSLRLGHPYHNP
jgi:23S rRNA (pseudouridine1915-N3)-methyltransferase